MNPFTEKGGIKDTTMKYRCGFRKLMVVDYPGFVQSLDLQARDPTPTNVVDPSI